MSRYNAKIAYNSIINGKETEYEYLKQGIAILGNKISARAYNIPTTEQMIGWLEEQENITEICIKRYGNWRYEIYIEPYHHQEEGGFLSRKEATLAAIDKALEHLTNNKKN